MLQYETITKVNKVQNNSDYLNENIYFYMSRSSARSQGWTGGIISFK